MKQKFIEDGYVVVEFEEIADVYIVNTCTVTNMADRKSRQVLRRVKQKTPNSILVVVGCYVQVGKEELEKIEEIDLILGNSEKNEIVKFVNDIQNQRSFISNIDVEKEYKDFGVTTYTENTRAFIKVQDGCNNFCTYCIIPYARGRVRSRKLENVIEEIKEISQKGIQEIVVTGIHIASYGKDFENNLGLIDLLEEINKIEGIKRIRLGSLEPKIITKEFVERLSKLEKICDQFHMSLQSGCDSVLKRMNRKYNTSEFEEGIRLIRTKYPNVNFTADIIVGFPGETEDEFDETYNFLKKIKFYKIHTFKYSKRKGTVAEKMNHQIVPEVQEERSKKVMELSECMQNDINKIYINKEMDVLFEENIGEYYIGHTSNYIKIKYKSEEKLENKILKIKLNDICTQ